MEVSKSGRKDEYHLECLKNVVNTQEPKAYHKPEEVWCASHNLMPAALNNISEAYDDIMNALHRFRPSFMVKINPPMYLHPSEFHHPCLHHEVLELEDTNALSLKAGNSHLDSQRCPATPYVSSTDFGATTTVMTLKALIKEMKIQLAEDKVVSNRKQFSGYVQPAFESEMCVFFARGYCTLGDTCPFSHSVYAPKPVCKFFLTLQGCRNGNSCSFSHDSGSLISSSITSGVCSQEERATSACCRKLLPAGGDGHILVMNDKNLQFSFKLCHCYDPSKIVVCTPGQHSVECDSVACGIKILQDVADPFHLIIGGEHKLPIPWTKVERVFWFADFDSDESSDEQVLLKMFFEQIAIKTLSEKLSKLQVILVMNNNKFVHLQAERLARDCFLLLDESFMFDEATLGWFLDTPSYPNGIQVSTPVAYVFNMHPPTGIQFGDYPTELREILSQSR